MNRKSFLKSLGLSSLAAIASPLTSLAANTRDPKHSNSRGGCVLVPSETAGPFPLDLSANEFYFRQDITEGLEGTTVFQKMRVIGLENCQPMPNVRVNIWCCDLEGGYSGYGDLEGLTYMRGYQITDENGEVEFRTIFPGWYNGRVVHMHFQVHVNSNYAAVSQFTWPHDTAVEIANNSPEIYTQGPDPMTPEMDGSFMDGYEHQLATLEWNASDQAYHSFIEVAVEGSGINHVGYLESQAAQVITLSDNSPNPATDQTTFKIDLKIAAEIEIEVWSISGKRLFSEHLGGQSAGQILYTIDCNARQLVPGSYIFQINVKQGGRTHNDLKRFLVI